MPSLHWIRIGGMSELDVSKLLTVREAIEVIDAVEVRPRVVEVELAEADGLVLAEEVRADRDYPPFDKSQMDGVAIRVQGSGFGVQGSELRLIGEVAAGQWPGRSVGEGEAMAIMTGAPMPAGADAVVPVEETVRVGERVKILKEPVAGKYIARKGSDVREGEVMLEKGVRVGPAQMAVLASVGKARVKCVARPRVAVLGTGDELVGVNEIPARGQIRNSNNVMLASLLQRYGCEVSDLGVVRDDREMIRQKIEAGMSADVLFVTGGMSMGEYDYVPKVLEELGVKVLISKIRIKPGKPFVFGTVGGVQSAVGSDQFSSTAYCPLPAAHYIFGLPGNPVSGYVCVVALASRLLQRLSGGKVKQRWVEGKLAERLEKNGSREFYQPAVVEDGRVTVLQWKGSADLFTLARANGLLVREENEPARASGEVVRVLEVPT